MSRNLHIYSQPYEHANARIVGNREALAALQRAISYALVMVPIGGMFTAYEDFFATDGEGYGIEIVLMPDESHAGIGSPQEHPLWKKYPPHYCDRGYDDDTHKAGVSDGK